MSEHKMTLKWERGGAEFSYQKYPRDHTWIFDGGHTMTATAAPAYLGNPANVDPEEAFVDASKTHRLLPDFFINICVHTRPVDNLFRSDVRGGGELWCGGRNFPNQQVKHQMTRPKYAGACG